MSKLKVSTKSKMIPKMTRHEYQSPEPYAGQVGKSHTRNSHPPQTKVGTSVNADFRNKNTNASKTQSGKANNNVHAKNETALEKKPNDQPNNADTNGFREIFVREESRSKRGIMIYREELMEKLLQQNYIAEERMRKERKNRTSSFFPLPNKNCETPNATPRSGDSGDGENRKISPDTNKNNCSPVIIKKTKIADSDLIEGDSPSVAVESKKKSDPVNLYHRILSLEEKNRLVKEENRVLRKCLRKYQELKVENVALTENIKKLTTNMDLLTSAKEIQNKVLTVSKQNYPSNNINQTQDLKSSLSYTVSTLDNNGNQTGKVTAKKSYSSRLLSMEQRVTDIVSILEIMKNLVVEQKLASEGTEKRFHEFIAEINAVSVLQNLHKLFASTKALTP